MTYPYLSPVMPSSHIAYKTVVNLVCFCVQKVGFVISCKLWLRCLAAHSMFGEFLSKSVYSGKYTMFVLWCYKNPYMCYQKSGQK